MWCKGCVIFGEVEGVVVDECNSELLHVGLSVWAWQCLCVSGSFCLSQSPWHLDYHLVEASAARAGDPGFESRLRRDVSASSHTSDLKIRTLVATIPGAWRYRASAGTG